MKNNEIKIGTVYVARVSGERTEVVPIARERTHKGRPAFRVRRLDNGRTLEKPRTASALWPAKRRPIEEMPNWLVEFQCYLASSIAAEAKQRDGGDGL